MCSNKEPQYKVYGSVSFVGTYEPDATGMKDSLQQMNMLPDASNALVHDSFLTKAVPYSFDVGFTSSDM